MGSIHLSSVMGSIVIVYHGVLSLSVMGCIVIMCHKVYMVIAWYEVYSYHLP